MDNGRLIGLVREYSFLYDLSDIKYSDNQMKDAAWMEIAVRLNSHKKECKKAWALLRDAFRRSIKRRKDLSHGQPHRKWKYEDEMSFLLAYMQERSIRRTTGSEETDDKRNMDGGWLSQNEETQAEEDRIPMQSSSTAMDIHKWQNCDVESKSANQENQIALLLQQIENDKIRKSDDIEQFFASIATTVKTFPLKDRANAKASVFQIISNLELEILSRPSIDSTSHLEQYSNLQSPDQSFIKIEQP